MNIYEKLKIILHKNPAGAPASKALDKILETFFTPDEAAVAVYLTFVPKSLSAIAEQSGLQAENAEKLCESLANKGIIFSRVKNDETGYSLLPLIPGIFEFPFMTGGGSAIHEKRFCCKK
jgi:electron transport complex protein RnfB